MNAPIDVSDIRIETDRLILRPWQEGDLEDLYEYACVDGVGEMAGWRRHGSIDESRAVLQMFIQGKKTFALELKENGKVIGSLGLEKVKDLDCSFDPLLGREIGYVLSKDYWGRGLMPEAVQAVIGYCFRVLGYDFLTCGHFAWNAQSSRVIEKCGFAFVKDMEYHTRLDTVERGKLYLLHNPEKVR